MGVPRTKTTLHFSHAGNSRRVLRSKNSPAKQGVLVNQPIKDIFLERLAR